MTKKSTPPALAFGASTAAERPVIDVFGHAYRLKRRTRSVARQNTVAEMAMNEFMRADTENEDEADRLVELFGDLIDARLAPENGSPPVRDLFAEKWQADEMDLMDIRAFLKGLDEVEEQARPT